MAADDWEEMTARLRSRGLTFEDGLSDPEVASAEARFGFRFPPDLRAFLQTALPSGEKFPDWRSGDEGDLTDWFDLPRQGVVFDVEHNGFWLEEWGPRPPSIAEAIQVAERLVAAAPRLIPVFMHRMMPAEPHRPGNPVFSVHQTDIIVYGTDLRDYLFREFLSPEDRPHQWAAPDEPRRIRFWDIDRFQQVRWGEDGGCLFDNSRGLLP